MLASYEAVKRAATQEEIYEPTAEFDRGRFKKLVCLWAFGGFIAFCPSLLEILITLAERSDCNVFSFSLFFSRIEVIYVGITLSILTFNDCWSSHKKRDSLLIFPNMAFLFLMAILYGAFKVPARSSADLDFIGSVIFVTLLCSILINIATYYVECKESGQK